METKPSSKFPCDLCQKIFTKKTYLTNHLRVHTREKLFKCHCGKSFVTKSALTKHQVVHSPLQPFQCDLCPVKLKRKGDLTKHLQKVHFGLKHACIFCPAEYATLTSLYDHLRAHIHETLLPSEGLFKCHCGKSFVTKSGLTKHQVVHSPLQPVQCDLCPVKLKRKGDLTKHLQKVHFGLRHACIFCPAEYATLTSLYDHLRAHIHETLLPSEGVFTCSVCEKGFASKVFLARHLRVHTGERPYKCTTCGKSFALKSSLQNHELVHSTEKRFKCKCCPEKFKQRAGLTLHMQKVHLKIKHSCLFCPVEYSNRQSLQDHIRKHIKEKPSSCGL